MTQTDILTPLLKQSAASAHLATQASKHVVSVLAHRAWLSGIVLAPDLVVTADEALPLEGELAIVTGEGKVMAEVVGRDPSTDIALLRVQEANLQPASLSDATPEAGSLIWSVGTRKGLPVVSGGMVSFVGPEWQSMRAGRIDARIELDLRLRQEAEGGLVVAADAQGIGMIVFGPRRRAIVIPSATIKRVVPLLQNHGRVPRGYLGLGLQPIRLDQGGHGLLVASVEAGGPGDAAKLHQGDIILEVDGVATSGMRGLVGSLGPESVGTTWSVRLLRGGEELTLPFAIGDRPTK